MSGGTRTGWTRTLGAVARWGFTIAATMIAAVWASTIRWQTSIELESNHFICLIDGSTIVNRHPESLPLPTGWSVRVRRPPFMAWQWWPPVKYGASKRGDGAWTLMIWLWLPFVVTALPGTYLWCRRVRAVPFGHCLRCRYNRAGLAEGVPCPECGKAT